MNSFKNALEGLEEQFSIRIDLHEELTSTNDTASQGDYAHGDVIIAEHQTKGRGQRGNRWESGAGENLTFSVVFQPNNFPIERQFYLSKIVSLALVEALSKFGIAATIKWPNDIYIGDRKVAGILIENDLMGANLTKSVAGIGLNVNQLQLDASLPNPISLALAKGETFDRGQVLKSYLDSLFVWFNRMDNSDLEPVDRAYSEYLYRKAGLHWFAEPFGEPFRAAIDRVLPGGELVLRREDGSCKSYLFKEVEFLIAP